MSSDPVLEKQIASFRRFTRYYTKAVGILRRFLLDTPFSVVEARILWELANRENVTAKYLAEELQIDAGYLSRLLKSLKARGLIRREKAAHDARTSYLFLTEDGSAAYIPLNENSRLQAEAILQPMSHAERAELVDAMELVEALLSKAPSIARPSKEPATPIATPNSNTTTIR